LINIESSWLKVLQDEFDKEYMKNLKDFLQKEQSSYTIYPKNKDLFNAFFYTPFDKVKVVILGQDPYHGENQACGLSFSVPNKVKAPPSLVNIFKELQDDLHIKLSGNTDLKCWANNGVFLLNSVLSVRKSEPFSHANQGWEIFSDKVIEIISNKKNNIVFILWGKYAQDKIRLIDQNKHLVIKSSHPSPLSSYRGFFSSKPFSRTNEYLKLHNKGEIDWSL